MRESWNTAHPICQMKVPVHLINTPKYPVIDMHTHFGPLVIGPDYAERYDTAETAGQLRKYGIKHVVNAELCWDGELEVLKEKLEPEAQFISTFPSVDISHFEDTQFEAYVDRTLSEYHRRGFKGIKLWKDITLYRKDSAGNHIRLDDLRLNPVFQLAGQYHLAVLIHVGDLKAFFTPPDEQNEYFQCLRENPQWSFCGEEFFSFEEHLRMQETVISRNPDTTFIIAHVGSCSEDLEYVSQLLQMFPNVYVDTAARISELGRKPRQAREFFLANQDRILFGTDYIAGEDPAAVYPYYYRFLETFDEYFNYGPEPNEYDMGHWKIYGIGLPDEILKKVYYQNAEKILKDDKF